MLATIPNATGTKKGGCGGPTWTDALIFCVGNPRGPEEVSYVKPKVWNQGITVKGQLSMGNMDA